MAMRRRAAARLARHSSSPHAAAETIEPIPRPRPCGAAGREVLVAILIGLAAPPLRAATLVVDQGSGPYYQIQIAITVASPYDTIEVHQGIYNERLQSFIPLTIRGRDGAGSTFLTGSYAHRTLEFEGCAITVEGLSFVNGSGVGMGGAVLVMNGTFQAVQCVFSDNHVPSRDPAQTEGGAVGFIGVSAARFVDCLFNRNGPIGASSMGGCVAIKGSGQSSDPAGAVASEGLPVDYIFRNCSFLSNRAGSAAAIWSTKPVDVRNCVFVDKQGTSGNFIDAPSASILECDIYHDLPSPEFVNSLAGRTAEVQVDPRICPDDAEAVHESSPLWTNWHGCGRIGNLPVGCTGPMVFAAEPKTLAPIVQQVRLYGYGLEEVLEARLEGPGGERCPGTILPASDTWLPIRFDLTEQPAGTWKLFLRTSNAGEFQAGIFSLSPIDIWGFVDGWVPAPMVYEGRVTGVNLWDGMVLRLEYWRDAAPALPVDILEFMGTDSIRVRVDLSTALEGSYDLVMRSGGKVVRAVRQALYLGTPPVTRVPEDFPTIGEALAAAAPFSEIRVAAGSYEDSLVIARPVRLLGVGSWPPSLLKPGRPGQRVIHVLPEAGPLTQIEGFTISGGRIQGPGAGIYCEAPALIRNNRIWANTATGPGARGAGIFAAPGARIIGNKIGDNRIAASTVNADVWSTDPGTGGVGGGLFCRQCWVEGNRFEDNDAPVAGGAIVEGEFLKNIVLPGFSDADYAGAGLFRGKITDNRFDGCCEDTDPYVRVEGPAQVLRNFFTFIGGLMCSGGDAMEWTGSIDLIGNVFANVGMRGCLLTSPAREGRPGHFRMEHNFFTDYYDDIEISYDENGRFCPWQGETGPYTSISRDSTHFACNIGDPDRVSIWRNGRREPCGSCVYRFENLPGACPDTIPDIRFACEPFPVLLESSGLEAVPGGVRLYWTIPLDVTVLGFDVDREVGGRTERLTRERLAPCRPCEYLDSSPVEGQTTTYTLRIYEGGAEPTSVILGTWDGARIGGMSLALDLAGPNPVRGRTVLRLAIPGGGRAIRLELLDVAGRIVSIVKEGTLAAGTHSIAWEARDDRGAPLPSGVYLMKLSAAGECVTRKLLVVH